MPRGNGTGPTGMGSMTGRGAGFCAGYALPGYANSGFGQGMGMGFGRGRGFRNRFFSRGIRRFGAYDYPYAPLAPDAEKQVLKNQAEALESELASVKNRINELEKTE